MFKRYQPLLLVLLAYIIVLVFYPSITANFVNLDDNVMVLGNEYIKSLSFDNIKKIFSDSYYKLYHPLVTLSYAVEYHFGKLDPYLYHIDNIFLHIFNTLLIFFIIRKISKSFFVSYITALIFAIHPVHIEAVTWVSSRKDTLYSFFFLLSLLFYMKSDESKYYKTFFCFSLLSFILSCFSKPTAVTLPAFLMLIDFYGNKLSLNSIKKYIPFFIISGIFIYIAVVIHYSPEEKIISTFFFKYVNFISAHTNILFYFFKFVFPLKLSVLYPYFFDNHAMMPWFVLYAPAALYTIMLFVLLSLDYNKKVFFGFFFFFFALLPSSGIMPTGVAPVADRYVYVSYAGLAYLVAEFLYFLYKKSFRWKIYVIFFITALSVFFGYLTYKRNIVWLDSVELMTEAVDYSPETANHAYLTRGIILKGKEKIEEAEKDLEKSFAINTDNVTIFFHLAHLRQLQERYDEAVDLYLKIPESYYDFAVVVNNLGLVLGEQGKEEKAINFIKKQIEKLGEDNSLIDYLYSNLALLYFKQENYDESLKYIELARQKNISNHVYYLQMMVIYNKKDDFENFEKTALEGLKNTDNNVSILNELANKYFIMGRYEDVEKLLVKEQRLSNDNHLGYFFLGNMAAMNNYFKSALVYYTMAILTAQQDNSGEYYFKRAAVYMILNEYELAKKNMEIAEKKGFIVEQDFKDSLNEMRDYILAQDMEDIFKASQEDEDMTEDF